MSDFQKPIRKKNALNNAKLRLSAPNPQAKGIWSTLAWDVFQNNPRIVVDTKDPNLLSQENGYGRITAPLDPAVFGAVLVNLENVINATEPIKFKVENSNHEYVNGQRSQEITHLTDLWVGRDAEGQIFISVVSTKPNWPIIKFLFGPSDNRYHKFLHGDGTPYSKADLSILFAKSYLNMLRALVPNVMDTHYFEAPQNPNWKKGGQGDGGSGGNRWGNNGGGNQGGGQRASQAPAADDMDDSIPF